MQRYALSCQWTVFQLGDKHQPGMAITRIRSRSVGLSLKAAGFSSKCAGIQQDSVGWKGDLMKQVADLKPIDSHGY